MSRHHYDIAQLVVKDAKSRAMNNVDLLEDVAHHNSVFFKAAWTNYEDVKPGSLRLIPNEDLAVVLRSDYSGMREMICGDVPSFDEMLSVIAAFELEING